MRRLLAICCLAFASLFAHAKIIDIDNAELARLQKSGGPVIDIRTQPEWEETGIVAGSRLLIFFDECDRADPAAWLDKAKAIVGANEPVIVICRSGNRTLAVSQFLSQQAGYSHVYNVKSGIKGWVVPATQSLAACRSAKTC